MAINTFWIDIEELAKSRGISKDVCVQCIKKAFLNTLLKKYAETTEDDFIIDYNSPDSTMSVKRILIDAKNKNSRESVKKAKHKEVEINIAKEFSNQDVDSLHKQLSQIISFEKSKNFYEKYKEAIGKLTLVNFYRYCKGYNIVKDEEGNELIFKETEKGDFKKIGNKNRNGKIIGTFKVYVKSIENKAGKVKVYVSRAGDYFIKKLLEENIPEIKDGTVVIKKIVRDITQRRSKVVVDSIDDKIDCIGSCIGPNKCRINAILKDLENETVDFVKYSNDLSVFIANVLSIPNIEGVNISQQKRYIIYVDKDFYDHAINGKKFLQLLLSNDKGNKIEIYKYSPTVNSLEIDELKAYFDNWIVNDLKRNKDIKTLEDIINNYTQEKFAEKFDFEEETVDNIFTVSAELIRRKEKNKKDENRRR